MSVIFEIIDAQAKIRPTMTYLFSNCLVSQAKEENIYFHETFMRTDCYVRENHMVMINPTSDDGKLKFDDTMSMHYSKLGAFLNKVYWGIRSLLTTGLVGDVTDDTAFPKSFVWNNMYRWTKCIAIYLALARINFMGFVQSTPEASDIPECITGLHKWLKCMESHKSVLRSNYIALVESLPALKVYYDTSIRINTPDTPQDGGVIVSNDPKPFLHKDVR